MKHESARGRGATLQIEGRFESVARERVDDGWGTAEEELPPLRTTVTAETAKSVIQRQKSPDLPFDYSLNAYRGCEHGCIYCYARPSHAYLNLSPGLDFETRLFAKPEAAQLLRAEYIAAGGRTKAVSASSTRRVSASTPPGAKLRSMNVTAPALSTSRTVEARVP